MYHWNWLKKEQESVDSFRTIFGQARFDDFVTDYTTTFNTQHMGRWRTRPSAVLGTYSSVSPLPWEWPWIARITLWVLGVGWLGFITGNCLFFGQIQPYYIRTIIRLTNIATALNEYTAVIGYADRYNGIPIDGAYFRHDMSTGNRQCVNVKASVETVVTTGITIVANRRYTMEISVPATASQVEYKIDDVVVATIVTNITTNITGFGNCLHKPWASSPTASLDTDYFYFE